MLINPIFGIFVYEGHYLLPILAEATYGAAVFTENTMLSISFMLPIRAEFAIL